MQPVCQGWHASRRAERARVMFSSEASAFLRSTDPGCVQTRPFHTVQNSADNSPLLHLFSS